MARVSAKDESASQSLRLDIFLKYSRLVPRRTVAQQLCDSGAVRLNGTAARSSHAVRVGDELVITGRNKITRAKITYLPQKPPSKAESAATIEILEQTRVEEDF